jgi:anti-anti-sigma regulatory factor
VRRIHKFIHVARITGASKLRISNLGLPNIEMEIPTATEIKLPENAQALYVTISGKTLNRLVAREGREILRSCMKREYSIVILDMQLVETADSLGLRWLARLKQTADWYNVLLQTRVSPTLALVLRLAGFAPGQL